MTKLEIIVLILISVWIIAVAIVWYGMSQGQKMLLEEEEKKKKVEGVQNERTKRI